MQIKLVLDTIAFIAGMSMEGECYTVNEVLEELKSEDAKLKASLALSQGDLKVREPDDKYINEVIKASKKTGDILNLSQTDIKLLALAMELKGIIITDDYDMQNLAKVLEIEYKQVAELGIRKIFQWKNICKGCGKIFPLEYKGRCDVCGSELKKIAKKVGVWKT